MAVDEVARHGGLVREIVGDVVVAVVCMSRTRDDAAERAVLATLAARDRLTTPGAGPPGRACRCWGRGTCGEVLRRRWRSRTPPRPGRCW